mmetsp:Transcript_32777/g.68563  ORF Transcript_32777/g.68563 Transcript_32777/m.68563 type:complete len:122 (-) Transcript_32777:740-1105(-)
MLLRSTPLSTAALKQPCFWTTVRRKCCASNRKPCVTPLRAPGVQADLCVACTNGLMGMTEAQIEAPATWVMVLWCDTARRSVAGLPPMGPSEKVPDQCQPQGTEEDGQNSLTYQEISMHKL